MPQRDMDLVRKLLFAVEEKANDRPEYTFVIEGYDDYVVQYHLVLMYEAGLIAAEVHRTDSGRNAKVLFIFRLTWDGHEFLSAAHDNTISNNVKKRALSKLSEVPFAVLKAALLAAIQTTVGS
jgi:uncharacterized protein DUF2513